MPTPTFLPRTNFKPVRQACISQLRHGASETIAVDSHRFYRVGYAGGLLAEAAAVAERRAAAAVDGGRRRRLDDEMVGRGGTA